VAGGLVQAAVVDLLVNDVATLATQNGLVEAARRAGTDLPGRRLIPYIFVAPREFNAIGRVAPGLQRALRLCPRAPALP
jgi:hypothetical protein